MKCWGHFQLQEELTPLVFLYFISNVTSSAQGRNLNSSQYQFSLAGEAVNGNFRVCSIPGIFFGSAGFFSSTQASPCSGFSCCRTWAPGHVGFSSCGTWAPELWLPGSRAQVELWNMVVAAAAKSLQSCPTLCDPIDGSPPGFSVPGILQARTLEWVAISSSNACMHAKSLQ